MSNINCGIDQAERLRKLVSDLRERSQEIIRKNSSKVMCGTRLIAVTSGKGGAGKTSFTANLAIELKKIGYKVAIIDGDLGLANVEVMFGIIPRFSLYEFIQMDLPLTEIINEGPLGVKFISGGNGITEMANLSREKFQKIVNSLAGLDNYADFILLDTGAGISNNVLNFVLAAKEVIILTNPEPTSITDSYAVLKAIKSYNHSCDIKIVANKVRNASEGQEIMDKLGTAASRFLNMEVNNLGYIMYDHSVSEAVRLQQPFVLSFPRCDASRNVKEIAQRLAENRDNNQSAEGLKSFLGRIYDFLNGGH